MGVVALLTRSAKLVGGHLAFVEPGSLESSMQLQAFLRAQEPAAEETAAALFGTFLALLETFIGERLTTEVLRSAWPSFDETAPKEKK
jgi:hypothetical protein